MAGRSNGQAPRLTVIVPTRDEAANVRELVRRLERALPDDAEVVFVDDSDDQTCAVVRAASRSSAIPIRLIHRPADRRNGGLSGAVVVGLRVASARHVCVMDADLQHPPDLVPGLLRRAVERDLDLVIASRKCEGGGTEDFGALRGLLSEISTLAARRLFPQRLRTISDPMSGFFLLRRDAVDLERLRPQGFKILLELLARNPGLRIDEVPFTFGRRYAGESKASISVGLRYLRQLAVLRLTGERRGSMVSARALGPARIARTLQTGLHRRERRSSR